MKDDNSRGLFKLKGVESEIPLFAFKYDIEVTKKIHRLDSAMGANGAAPLADGSHDSMASPRKVEVKAQKRMTYADFLVKKRALSSQLKRKFADMAAGGGSMLAIVALGGGDLILTSVSADVNGHDRIHIANGIATILYLLLILAWYICEYISMRRRMILRFCLVVFFFAFIHESMILLGPLLSMRIIYEFLCWKAIVKNVDSPT